ncbi:hypothetical protein KQX54_011482 [Cotesia glomerata]|uniref:Uncharacterized protein n=1 Tax=Cotesia glomerata TaxID=32391 RepID=A0AAV7IS35_COTGL|nr:hypothetical protein KQX54_011482 [Cotesia glomerata]
MALMAPAMKTTKMNYIIVFLVTIACAAAVITDGEYSSSGLEAENQENSVTPNPNWNENQNDNWNGNTNGGESSPVGSSNWNENQNYRKNPYGN